ncbi:MAG: NUMOD4 domain-containing protein [Burkholderiales bacterium]
MEYEYKHLIPEVWVSVRGWEGKYQVSNHGRFRSCTRWVIRSDGKLAIIPSKIHKPTLSSGVKKYNGSGKRMYVKLSGNGTCRSVLLNRLVARAFLPNLHGKPEVNHINANPLENQVWNLEWSTKRENMDHAAELGLIGRNWNNIRHIIRCVELGITTIGVGRMVEILSELGKSVDFPRVLRCALSNGKKTCAGLSFRSIPISELNGMSSHVFSEKLGIPS